MEANIRLVEDRVQRLLRRLRELSAEKTRLESENRTMKARLAEAEDRGAMTGEGWPMSPDRVAAVLREAIRELQDT